MLAIAIDFLWHLAPFILVLSLVVTVHELGHFFAARACGIDVERFSIGFGRPIWSRRDRTGVEWRIGWVPLGGYVMFAGDHNAASVPDAAGLKAMRAEIRRNGRAPFRHGRGRRPWRAATTSSPSGSGPWWPPLDPRPTSCSPSPCSPFSS